MTFQRTYKATAWLQIKEQPDYLAFKTDASSRFVQNQIELLRGPLVLEKVLAKPEVAQLPEVRTQASPLEWLQKNVMAKNVGGSDLFELSFTGLQPESSATIVNTIVRSYLEVSSQKTEEQTAKVVELLTKERDRRGKEVERLRDTVRTLAKQLTGKDPFAATLSRDSSTIQSPLAALQERLATTEVDRQVLEARATALAESLSGSPIDVPAEILDQMVESRPEIAKVKQEIENDRARQEEVKRVAQPGYTKGISAATAQIGLDEQFLEEVRAKLKKSIAAELTSSEAKRRREMMGDLQAQLANLKLTENLLRGRVEKFTKSQVETGGNTVELEFAKGELQRAESVFDRIADRILALTTETNAPERVTQLRAAAVPTEPEVKSPFKMIVMASLVAFVIPFVLVVGWERHVRRIVQPDQIMDELYLPVVGEISSLPLRRLSNGTTGTRVLSWCARCSKKASIRCGPRYCYPSIGRTSK